jgi:hypothetical protein
MEAKEIFIQRNKIRIIIITLCIFIITLYANPALFGFSKKPLSVAIHCTLVLLIPMLSILLLNELTLRSGIIASIIILIFFLPYFFFSDKIITYEELSFFKERQHELSKLSLEILNNKTKNICNNSINEKLQILGIDSIQRNYGNIIFKISSAKYMFNGYIYSQKGSLPCSAFGIRINEIEKIGEHWYSFSCDSLNLN